MENPKNDSVEQVLFFNLLLLKYLLFCNLFDGCLMKNQMITVTTLTPIAQHRDIGYTLTDLKNHSEAARNNLSEGRPSALSRGVQSYRLEGRNF